MAVDGMVGSLFGKCMVRYMAVFSSADVGYTADPVCACADNPPLLSAHDHEGECNREVAGSGVIASFCTICPFSFYSAPFDIQTSIGI